MNRKTSIAALIAACALLPAASQAATLTLVLSGTAFDGPPTFSVQMGGKELADGSVDIAIDSTTAVSLSEAVPKATMTFDVDLGAAAAGDLVELRLTNDKWAGEGVLGDRNLFVVSAAFDDTPVDLSSIGFTVNGEAARPPVQNGGFLALARNAEVASFAVPDSVAAVTEPAVTKPAAEAATEVAAVAPAEAVTDVECKAVQEQSVTGFATNAAALPEGALEILASVGEGLDLAGCEIVVTGYASLSGPAEWNVKLAEQRAQTIAGALRDSGLEVGAVDVGGQTDTFGPAAVDNQRVVITIR